MKRHPYVKIVVKATFTLFNLVNLILAAMVLWVGSYKNMLFAGVAILNTLISIVNNVRAQRMIDRLRLTAEQKPLVERGGSEVRVDASEVRRGDVMVLALGDQILFDAEVLSGQLEVNEAFVTGEQDNIPRGMGEKLVAGSFVVAGEARARVLEVGAENSLAKIEAAAHEVKTADSQLFVLMNKIVKYISYALVPIGALLLWARFRTEADTATAVTSTVAALINMIPEGLILLTSSILALAAVRLARRKVLVQDLYAIETLARVDCICLDKTGTLTTGRMRVRELVDAEGVGFDLGAAGGAGTSEGAEGAGGATEGAGALSPAQKSLVRALNALTEHQMGETGSISALREKLAQGPKFGEIEGVSEVIPFSSERKYSGFRTASGEEYLIGATEFLTSDPKILALKPATGRVLAVVQRESANLPLQLLGFVVLEDELRSDAKEIMDYFYENQIAPVVISGDDAAAVTTVAEAVGLREVSAVELTGVKRKDYKKLVREYNIFARVTPAEKQELVKALKAAGRTVAMTGDGVNDILAMKEADCSIAMGAGSDAARRAARMVLLDSGFEAVPRIIAEGRQSINNLERSTSLFLAKTVYAAILAVLFTVAPLPYPFTPIEMTLLNFACIGLPGVVLALEPNTARIKNQFVANIRRYSLPAGVAVALSAVALSAFAGVQGLTREELTTMSVFAVGVIDVVLIYAISRPLNALRGGLLAVIVGIMLAAFLLPLGREFFEFTLLTWPAVVTEVVVVACGVGVFYLGQVLGRKA